MYCKHNLNKVFSNKKAFFSLLLVFSFIVGGILTNYLEFYEQKLVMPLRNFFVLGVWNNKSDDKIPISFFPQGQGINPVHIAQTVRPITIEILEEGNKQSLTKMGGEKRLLDIADFFIDTAEIKHHLGTKFYIWAYDFDWPFYEILAPWTSGMAQGFVIEIMIAAYKITKNEKYLETARLAANAMAIPINTGGVAIKLSKGLWFEEYAKTNMKPPHVLNGHIFALNALWYLAELDQQYKQLFEDGLMGLRFLLPSFDAHIWSKYDLAGTPANRKYQRIHVYLLEETYKRTRDIFFLDYAKKFRLHLFLPFGVFYRIATYPNRFLVLIFLGNSVGVFFFGLIVSSLIQRRQNFG